MSVKVTVELPGKGLTGKERTTAVCKELNYIVVKPADDAEEATHAYETRGTFGGMQMYPSADRVTLASANRGGKPIMHPCSIIHDLLCVHLQPIRNQSHKWSLSISTHEGTYSPTLSSTNPKLISSHFTLRSSLTPGPQAAVPTPATL